MNMMDTFRAGAAAMAAIDRTDELLIVPAVIVPKGATLANLKIVALPDVSRLIRSLELKLAGPWTEAGGAMRWKPQDWSHETNLPYLLSQREPQSRFIARQRLTRWIDFLQRYEVPVTPGILALAWEVGLTKAMVRVKKGRSTPFADSVVQLYDNLGC